MNSVFLKNNRAPVAILAIIILVSGMFMIWSSSEESAIMDELAHVPAGYGYVKYLDYRLNPEHPPILKALSALPLIFIKNLKFPENSKAWEEDTNGQWDVGTEFLYKSGNNADSIIFYARIFPIILTLVTAILIFIWGSKVVGRFWALLPVFLFALSPNVLAHGHYATTDMAATFGAVIASYFFIKALESRSVAKLLVAGGTFGVAELMKFSMVLLVPYFLILGIVFAISQSIRAWKETTNPWNRLFLSLSKSIGKTFFVFLVGLIIIYGVYALFVINYPKEKQIKDTITILESFSPKPIAQTVVYLANKNILRPIAEYFLGILMVLQRSSGGNTNYFMGSVSTNGSWYYFPLVYLLKEPLPILIIILSGLALAIKRILLSLREGGYHVKKALSSYFGTRFGEFGMLLFVLIYWAYSIKSPLNIGLRHIFPTLPFFYILAVSALRKWHDGNILAGKNDTEKKGGGSPKLITLAMVIWLTIEAALTAPNFLSYFNEIGGGKFGGYRFVTDSNYDWGQDLKTLRDFVEEKNIEKIAVDYFGGGSPAYYLGEISESWWSARGNPKDVGIGWLAVSANTLQGAMQPTASGFQRKTEDGYWWLREWRPPKTGLGELPQPDFRIGTSIFIYEL